MALCLTLALLINLANWNNDPSLVKSAPAQAGVALKAIEDIDVGERVLTGVSEHARQLAVEAIGNLPAWDGEAIVEEDWRKVQLTLARHEGNSMEIILLRPLKWLEENRIEPGNSVYISIPEMQQSGFATIATVAACPSLPAGNGAVVTGTFTSAAAEVIDLRLADHDQPIRCTPEHLLFCVNDQRFVPARELSPGDRVQHLSGTSRIRQVSKEIGQHRVYNLEVHAEHVFRVAPVGLLVHNAWGEGASAPLPNQDTLDRLEREAEAMRRAAAHHLKAIQQSQTDMEAALHKLQVDDLTEMHKAHQAQLRELARKAYEALQLPPSLN